MVNNLVKQGFGIKIDFTPASSPSHIFRALSALIDSIVVLDRDLLGFIDIKAEVVLMLENIENGSIIAWFINTLKSIPDDAIEDLELKKIIGVFLNKARYAVIQFTNKKKAITREEIEKLQEEVIRIAQEAQVKSLPIYTPTDTKKLLTDISNMQTTIQQLSNDENVSYITSDSEVVFNKSFALSETVIEQILTKETISSRIEMILKVKRPDYLEDTKWEFRFESKTFSAKVIDSQWLNNFRLGKVDLRPGSSLRCWVEVTNSYDYDHEVISTQNTIVQVIEVIPPVDWEQGKLL